MKKLTLPQAIIIASIIICLAVVFNSLSDRYYLDASLVIKVDKLTGKTYSFNEITESWESMDNPKNEDNTNSVIDYLKDSEKFRLFMDSEIYFDFKRDYMQIIKIISHDPLAYNNSSYPMLQNYKKYSSLINVNQITKAYLEEDIDNSWDFLKYLLKSIDN